MEEHLAAEGVQSSLFTIPGFDIWRALLGVACTSVNRANVQPVLCGSVYRFLVYRLSGVQAYVPCSTRAQHQLATTKGFSQIYSTPLTWESFPSAFPPRPPQLDVKVLRDASAQWRTLDQPQAAPRCCWTFRICRIGSLVHRGKRGWTSFTRTTSPFRTK